ncbi:MAG: FAD-dependent oxidoreductase, partial [Planctomycetes bacterium]|nr:FAD-dependent oxidoreductase [Planctomycetota bacterium]
MSNLHDVLILGASPAGLAAAYYLAGKGADVFVLDAPRQNTECPLYDWLPRTFFRRAYLPPDLADKARARTFARVLYHNAALDSEVEYRARTAAGYFVHAPHLVKALRSAATGAGARIRTAKSFPSIDLKEETVELVGPQTVRGRILMIAQNRPNDILGELAMPLRSVPEGNLLIAALDVPLGGRKASFPAERGGVLHVVELPERTELGLFFRADGVLHLRVISNSAASGMRAAELSGMVNGLQRKGLLPGGLPLSKAQGAVWAPPAGVALELETHVAKRCVLVGTAGGFAESITGQTLAPSIRSAILAADVVLSALASSDPQGT